MITWELGKYARQLQNSCRENKGAFIVYSGFRLLEITDTVIHTAAGETWTVEGGYLDIGILDTMKDLLVNLVGAVVFSLIGYSTLKFSKSSKVADSLVIKPKEMV